MYYKNKKISITINVTDKEVTLNLNRQGIDYFMWKLEQLRSKIHSEYCFSVVNNELLIESDDTKNKITTHKLAFNLSK